MSDRHYSIIRQGRSMMLTRRMFLGIAASSAIGLGLGGRNGFPKWEKEFSPGRADKLLPVSVDGRYGYILFSAHLGHDIRTCRSMRSVT